MSQYNRKGNTTIMARTANNKEPHPVAVRKGSYHDKRQQAELKKFKKAQKKAFREYKENLKAQKKLVPKDQRAKVNWSAVPERFFDE
jgi:hypothetical protein